MKITKRHLRRIIKEAMTDYWDARDKIALSGMKFDSDTPMQTYVDKHIDDFIDGYITRASGGSDRFLEWWEMTHCEENDIPCTQDHLAALVDRAEQMGEVEEGELFVGLRGT